MERAASVADAVTAWPRGRIRALERRRSARASSSVWIGMSSKSCSLAPTAPAAPAARQRPSPSAHPAIEPAGLIERHHNAVAVELAGILPADPPTRSRPPLSQGPCHAGVALDVHGGLAGRNACGPSSIRSRLYGGNARLSSRLTVVSPPAGRSGSVIRPRPGMRAFPIDTPAVEVRRLRLGCTLVHHQRLLFGAQIERPAAWQRVDSV